MSNLTKIQKNDISTKYIILKLGFLKLVILNLFFEMNKDYYF